MTTPDATQLFYTDTGLDPDRTAAQVADALNGCDDGELYLQYGVSESFAFDDGRLKSASFDTVKGFGLRGVAGEMTAFAHANDLSHAAIARAADTIKVVRDGHGGTMAMPPMPTNARRYTDANPLAGVDFSAKVALLEKVEKLARARDPRVAQVMAGLAAEHDVVLVARADGTRAADVRPLVRLSVTVIAEQKVGGEVRREVGSGGGGGRFGLAWFSDEVIRSYVDHAVDAALTNLESRPAPAGEMAVVLGPGWPGVLLHEAVGHGLEGDFNRKGSSVFSGRIGQRVAAKGVTVLDDGTIADRRGSLNVDDEGCASQRNVLIEDGILKGYIQDRLNARMMGVQPTGNGRRESYAHVPMPRMTNTYMLGGDCSRDEIVASIRRGLYATNFGGGQVDITNGKFVFSASEAYWVENGRIQYPVKGATLIGNGPESLKRISMIGNDMALDTGVGTCGKEGQSVPVGVGQPTLKIDRLTVGGTA